MTPHMKYGIAGVVIGLILFIISPWLAIAVIAASRSPSPPCCT